MVGSLGFVLAMAASNTASICTACWNTRLPSWLNLRALRKTSFMSFSNACAVAYVCFFRRSMMRLNAIGRAMTW